MHSMETIDYIGIGWAMVGNLYLSAALSLNIETGNPIMFVMGIPVGIIFLGYHMAQNDKKLVAKAKSFNHETERLK